MTDTTPAKPNGQTPRRLLRWLPAIVLFLGCIYMTHTALRLTRNDPGPTRLVAPPPTDPPDAADFDRLLNLADPAAGAAARLGQPLDHEPAHLPEPDGGVRLARYRADADGVANEYAVWLVAGKKLASAASFYTEAALREGFAMIGESTNAERRVVRRTFRRGDRVLVVRARQAGDGVRLVLHLRYTLSSPATPTGNGEASE